jgi:DNA methylase
LKAKDRVDRTKQLELFAREPETDEGDRLLTIRQASDWASEHTGKNVTPSNISYLIQYGRIEKIGSQGTTKVSRQELIEYYKTTTGRRADLWRERLGSDLNWGLSFENFKEAETTKHVHRLHPYKGKFIPQLVEYFLDQHTDEFKRETFFKPGDIVLDPFSGSGTTMVQACELGIHSIGIDVSAFNALIGNTKVAKYDLREIKLEVDRITAMLKEFVSNTRTLDFERELLNLLTGFNNQHFPVPEFKFRLHKGEINEVAYGSEREKLIQPKYANLVEKFRIELKQKKSESFLDRWYSQNVRNEIDFVSTKVAKIKDETIRAVVRVILSRTIRSCRATTHVDLGTLIEPVTAPYYCSKHGKICKPLFSILKWWQTYAKDTVKRIALFDERRSDTFHKCIVGDSRQLDIFEALDESNSVFARLIKKKKIKGIFSSPPYVGLIDYHEQHAYAYDLFGLPRNDESEIGPLFKGQGKEARDSYIQGVSQVLQNCKRYMTKDFEVFLVANDKFGMYPSIAEKAGMRIANQFLRPVLNRTERDKAAYAETIFHLRRK